MKHYLLSWYGITDLRAALGLEQSDGPLFSALKTGEYTDVVLLAYTDDSKSASPESGLDGLKNTGAGHQVYVDWLQRVLAAEGIEVAIHLLPQSLAHLNDANGIHHASTEAVRLALADPDCARLTTYVSPGTPVMAYTWALIARSNPQLDIRVISSSDATRPPEIIDLPRSLLDAGIGSPLTAPGASPSYQRVIHLLGNEVMPIYFGLRQFGETDHVMITTKDFQAAAKRLAKAGGSEGKPVLIDDPFKPSDTRKAIAAAVADLPPGSNVAVNMTGGTKLMFAGALSACWELGLDPIYFEVKHHTMIRLRDGSQVPFVGLSSVEDFFEAGGVPVITQGHWEDHEAREERSGATRSLWESHRSLGRLYGKKDFRALLARRDAAMPTGYEFEWGGNRVAVDKAGFASMELEGEPVAVPGTPDFLSWLSGGWLEEYVYLLLRPLEEEGLIRDVRISLEIGMPTTTQAGIAAPSAASTGQEFDCVFTDGKRLWLVECKAGNITQADVQKLENSLKRYGGVAARGLLISSFPPGGQADRIKQSRDISSISDLALSTENLRSFIQRAQ